jgi:hypothetical protein
MLLFKFRHQMSTVATILPMSLLACLGSDAEAIRDILIHRLEAQTEDILLKIAIVKFFRSVMFYYICDWFLSIRSFNET